MILIVGSQHDEHVRLVADRLRTVGHPVVELDAADHDAASAVGLQVGELGGDRHLGARPSSGLGRRLETRDGRTIDLEAVTGGWWRQLPPAISADDFGDRAYRDAMPAEPRAALDGVLASLDIPWANDPLHDRRSRHRPLLWAAGAAAGLALPRTLVTRDPGAALDFLAGLPASGAISFPLVRRVDDWWTGAPVGHGDEAAERVLGATGDTVLQAVVPGDDVRVIVAGSAMFAVELAGRPLDLPIELALADHGLRRTELPDPVFEAVAELMARLGLVTASVDLRRTAEGEHVLLDLDPTPQWSMIEELTAWPITRAVADLLAQRARARRPISGRSAARP